MRIFWCHKESPGTNARWMFNDLRERSWSAFGVDGIMGRRHGARTPCPRQREARRTPWGLPVTWPPVPPRGLEFSTRGVCVVWRIEAK